MTFSKLSGLSLAVLSSAMLLIAACSKNRGSTPEILDEGDGGTSAAISPASQLNQEGWARAADYMRPPSSATQETVTQAPQLHVEFGPVVLREEPKTSVLDKHDSNDYSQIFPGGSGAVDRFGREFQDTKNDPLLNYLKDRIASIPDDKFFQDSINLALATSDLSVRILSVGNRARSAEVSLRFEEAGRQVRVNLVGTFDGQGRVGELFQMPRAGESAEFDIRGRVFCVDKEGSCENRVIEIQQYIDGELCKIAYYVDREMHIHLHDALDAVSRARFSTNRMFQGFMRYLENTMRTGSAVMPYVRELKMHSWIAAYGPGFFAVTFTSGISVFGERDQDVLTLYGPSLPNYDNYLQVDGKKVRVEGNHQVAVTPHRPGTPNYAEKISSARLLANNGSGIFNVALDFCDPECETPEVAETALFRLSPLGKAADLEVLRGLIDR